MITIRMIIIILKPHEGGRDDCRHGWTGWVLVSSVFIYRAFIWWLKSGKWATKLQDRTRVNPPQLLGTENSHKIVLIQVINL